MFKAIIKRILHSITLFSSSHENYTDTHLLILISNSNTLQEKQFSKYGFRETADRQADRQ